MTNRFTDSGLAPTSQHTYAVLAVDGAGNKSATATVVGQGADTTPPSIPTGLTATPFSQTRIDLTWNASTDTASGVAGYRVYRDGVLVGSPTATAYSDTGLGVGTNHTYRVAAIDVAGNLSAQCTAVAQSTPDQTAPSVPGGLTATVISSTEIDLAWNASTDVGVGIAGYRLYRAGVQIVQQAGRTYANTGLTAGTQYSYQISAYDSAGNESAKSTAVLATTQSGGSLGTLVHGQSFTVTGSGFGAQSGGVVVRDYGQDPVGTLNGAWTKGWPNSSTVASANIQNQLVSYNPTGAAVGAPHALVSKFTCGAHYTTGTLTSSSCYNVCLAYGYTAPAKPYCFYIHAFERNDNNWTFNIGSPPDNNYKQTIDFTGAAGPYDGSNGVPNWDQTAQNFPSNNTAGISYSFDDGAGDFVRDLENPDANGHNLFWGSGASPWQGWIDKETRMGVTDQTGFAGGYIQTWELGASASRKVNYVGATDRHPGSGRMIVLGGYTRNYPAATNIRYFGDAFVYISGTGTFNPTLVFVCDQPTYAASALRIPQVPISWIDTEVKFNFWQGKAALGQSAYVIVQDVSGGEHSYGPYQISAPATFDYFIGPSGSDGNAGTQGAPWTIKALETKTATIAGKRIGLLDGTYRVTDTTGKNANNNDPLIRITAANVTIAAVNTRQAIITSNNGSGSYPPGTWPIIGANANGITFDGLVMTDMQFYAVAVQASNITIKNCEISNIVASRQAGGWTSGDNVGGVMTGSMGTGLLIDNCYVHDVYNTGTSSAANNSCLGPLYSYSDVTISNCTLKNSGFGFGFKRTTGKMTAYNNFIANMADYAIRAMPDEDPSVSPHGGLFHHNLMVNCSCVYGSDSPQANMLPRTTEFYNNTVVYTASYNGNGIIHWNGPSNTSGVATANKYYNNIFHLAANLNQQGGHMFFYTGTNNKATQRLSVCNWNNWGVSAAKFSMRDGDGVTYSTIAAWRTATGFDANSLTSDALFVNIAGTTAADFKLQAGSPCLGAGKVGGVSGGAAVDMGAWGGTNTIGCNF